MLPYPLLEGSAVIVPPVISAEAVLMLLANVGDSRRVERND
jgi:hypothetical protein